MRPLLIFALVLVVCKTSAQSNLVFSIPKEYDVKIAIPGYNSTRPQTWQVKFENIQQGNIKVNVIIMKPGASTEERTFILNVERGYEYTYFITPYKGGPECNIANAYTLEQVYGQNHTNTQPTNTTGRLQWYNGKPVPSETELAAFVNSIKERRFGSDMLKFCETYIPKFYFYVEDVERFLKVFQFDDDKVKLAKLAYDHTINKHMYFSLKNSFKFTSSFEEVETYISKR